IAAALNLSSESQLADIEGGKSPLEKIGVSLGRIAVKYGVPVSQLLNFDGENESCGNALRKLRLQSSLSVGDVCRSIFPDFIEDMWPLSEKEMTLIENGNHGSFERWIAVLRAFCLVTEVDVFALVVGL
ncbi:Hypothetical protein, putative, partial [Bodo saltans]